MSTKHHLPANVGTIRCESGYLVLSDPGYTWNNFRDSPDGRGHLRIDDSVADPAATIGRGIDTDGLALDVYGADIPGELAEGLVFAAPVGTHYVVADTHGNLVKSVTIRLDGKTEPLKLEDGRMMMEDLAVDFALMAVHDPSLTLTGESGPHYPDWDSIALPVWSQRDGDVPEAYTDGVIPRPYDVGKHKMVHDPDGSGILAVVSAGYGDGMYPVSIHQDENDIIYGITVKFAGFEED